MVINLSPKELERLQAVYNQQPGWIKAMCPDLEAYVLYLFLKQLSHMEDDFMPRYLAAVRADVRAGNRHTDRPTNQGVTVERTASRRPARAESVTKCACGCGQDVSGRAQYASGACRTRVYRQRLVGV